MLLAFEFCSDPGVLQVLYILKSIINALSIIIPIVLILLVSLDFLKGTIANSKQAKDILPTSMRRIVSAVLIFFVPMMVGLTLDLISSSGKSDVIDSVNTAKNSIKDCWNSANPNGVREARERESEEQENPPVEEEPISDDPIEVTQKFVVCNKIINKSNIKFDDTEQKNVINGDTGKVIIKIYNSSFKKVTLYSNTSSEDEIKNLIKDDIYYKTISLNFSNAELLKRNYFDGLDLRPGDYELRRNLSGGSTTFARALYFIGFFQNGDFDYNMVENNSYSSEKLYKKLHKDSGKKELTDIINEVNRDWKDDRYLPPYYIYGTVTKNGDDEHVLGYIDRITNDSANEYYYAIKFYSELLGGFKYIGIGENNSDGVAYLSENGQGLSYKEDNMSILFKNSEYITYDNIMNAYNNINICNSEQYMKYLTMLSKNSNNGPTVNNFTNKLNDEATPIFSSSLVEICGKRIEYVKHKKFAEQTYNKYQKWLGHLYDKGFSTDGFNDLDKYLLFLYTLVPMTTPNNAQFPIEFNKTFSANTGEYAQYITSNSLDNIKKIINIYLHQYIAAGNDDLINQSLKQLGIFKSGETLINYNGISDLPTNLSDIGIENNFLIGKYQLGTNTERNIIGTFMKNADNETIIVFRLSDKTYSIKYAEFEKNGNTIFYETDDSVYVDNFRITFSKYFTLDSLMSTISGINVCSITNKFLNNYSSLEEGDYTADNLSTLVIDQYEPTRKVKNVDIMLCGNQLKVDTNVDTIGIANNKEMTFNVIKNIIKDSQFDIQNESLTITPYMFVKYYTSSYMQFDNCSINTCSFPNNSSNLTGMIYTLSTLMSYFKDECSNDTYKCIIGLFDKNSNLYIRSDNIYPFDSYSFLVDGLYTTNKNFTNGRVLVQLSHDGRYEYLISQKKANSESQSIIIDKKYIPIDMFIRNNNLNFYNNILNLNKIDASKTEFISIDFILQVLLTGNMNYALSNGGKDLFCSSESIEAFINYYQ